MPPEWQTDNDRDSSGILKCPERRYWLQALRDEVEAVWGKHKVYKHQIEELAYYAFLTTFYDNDLRDIRNRRRSVYYYLAGPYAADRPDDPLVVHAHMLPIDSIVPRALDGRAIAYNLAPERKVMRGEKEDENATKILRAIYRDAGFDGRIQRAYKYAMLCSGVLVRPYIDFEGEWRLRILPPDLCRYETDPDNPERLTKVVIPVQGVNAMGKGELQFEVWTDTTRYRTDYEGAPTRWFEGEELIDIDGVENPYGRIPYVLFRMTEPNDGSLFSGGLFHLVEGAVAANADQFKVDSSTLYESWGHWLAINLGLASNPGARFGGGRVTAKDNVEGGNASDLAPPQLDHVSTNGQYAGLYQQKQNRVADLLIGLGSPPDEARGEATIQSGVARLIQRLPLLERRDDDLLYLRPNERRLARMVILEYNTVYAPSTGAPLIPDPERLICTVDYADEMIYDDEDKARERQVKDLLGGLLSPSRFYQLRTGADQQLSDKEAIEKILGNQRMVAEIRAGLNGGAPTEEVPVPVPVETAGAEE